MPCIWNKNKTYKINNIEAVVRKNVSDFNYCSIFWTLIEVKGNLSALMTETG